MRRRTHLAANHKGKPTGVGAFECEICGEKCSSEANLKNHKRTHKSGSNNDFKCETCDKIFTTDKSLKAHIYYVHNPQTATYCEKCGKLFKTKIKLDQHMSYVHTDPSQWRFPCTQEGCEKRCWSRQKLTEHIRTHTKECPFVCDFCGKAFRWVNFLKCKCFGFTGFSLLLTFNIFWVDRYRQYLRTHLAKVHGTTAAKALTTQPYTKPFDQTVKRVEVDEDNDDSKSSSSS